MKVRALGGIMALIAGVLIAVQWQTAEADIALREVRTIASGYRQTCALENGGAAYCWGTNTNGQLGNNSTTDSSIPVAVSGSLAFTGISTGYKHSCGITTTHEAYCWGINNVGQLGTGNTTESHVPVAVTGSHSFARISASFQHTCAITLTGDAYCWGYNNQGQLGEGGHGDSWTPILVLGSHTFVQINTGQRNACGLTDDAEIWCWGDNSGGQIGDNNQPTDVYVPTLVVGGHQWSTMASSDSLGQHVCALDTDGLAWCWGVNQYGAVGDGTLLERPVPVAVQGGIVFESLTIGSWHTCGLTAVGAAYCWGVNVNGQLGVGNTTDSSVPVAVGNTTAFESIAPGQYATCALQVDGDLVCAGSNAYGQLGDGTLTTRSTFAPVTGSTQWEFNLMQYVTPTAPSSVAATAGSSRASVAFAAPTSVGGSAITSYTVTSSPGGITATGNGSPITVTGLTAGTSYTFTVSAANTAGAGPSSSASSAVTPFTTPSAPSITSVSAGDTQVDLAWSTPSSDGGDAISDYVVEFRKASGAWAEFADGTSTTRSATVSDLENGSAYEFRVSAANGAGAGAASTIASTTPMTTSSNARALAAVSGDGQVKLSWAAPSDDGGADITDYIVEYRVIAGTWTTFADGISAATTATVTGLTNGTSYEFRVTPSNAAGSGTTSATVVATPLPPVPTISQVAADSVKSTSATVAWYTDRATDTRVRYGPSPALEFATATSNATNRVTRHSATLSNLQPCAIYWYSVVSTSAFAQQVTSAADSFTTGGCDDERTVEESAVVSATAKNGGTVSLTTSSGSSVRLTAPARYSPVDTLIQVKRLDGAITPSAGLPSPDLDAIDSLVFDVRAFRADTGALTTSFDRPITFELSYAQNDVADLDESTLVLSHWHDGEWSSLNDCTTDTVLNTIRCTTTGFSVFSLFASSGELQVAASPGGSSTSGGAVGGAVSTPAGSTLGALPTPDAISAKSSKFHPDVMSITIMVVVAIIGFVATSAFRRMTSRDFHDEER